MITAARAASLQDVLDARERRVELQRKLLAENSGCTLICFTLNLMGYLKRYALSDRLFEYGIDHIEAQLSRVGTRVSAKRVLYENTGCTAYFCVDAPALETKRLMAELEDAGGAARLWDIDVLDEAGQKISGSDVGRAARKCLLCERPAAECGRSRAHTAAALYAKTLSLQRECFHMRDADEIAKSCVRALLCEVCTTPKPGLVDRAHNGSHSDMDIFTFMDSAAALTPYLRELALEGLRFGSPDIAECASYMCAPRGVCDNPANLPQTPAGAWEDEAKSERFLSRLRLLGVCAERDMRLATNGVNTHKGILFSMGLLAASAGYLLSKNNPELCACEQGAPSRRCPVLLSELLSHSASLAAHMLRDTAKSPDKAQSFTSGERLYRESGVAGVRGEAASGFASVRTALPKLRQLIRGGMSLNDAGARVLLLLIASTDDSNIAARAGVKRQREIKALICRHLEQTALEKITGEWIASLDSMFVRENVSPGGSADLLALSYMLYFLSENLQSVIKIDE